MFKNEKKRTTFFCNLFIQPVFLFCVFFYFFSFSPLLNYPLICQMQNLKCKKKELERCSGLLMTNDKTPKLLCFLFFVLILLNFFFPLNNFPTLKKKKTKIKKKKTNGFRLFFNFYLVFFNAFSCLSFSASLFFLLHLYL